MPLEPYIFIGVAIGLLFAIKSALKPQARGRRQAQRPRHTQPASSPPRTTPMSYSALLAKQTPTREVACPACAAVVRVASATVALDVKCPACRLVFSLPVAEAPPVPSPSAPVLTLALLQELEWRRFEEVTEAYFQHSGWLTRPARIGPDGGVDIHLTPAGGDRPTAVVQCKAWLAYKVGVKPIRELFGVMAADGAPEGYFVTSGEYTAEALTFAAGKRLTLIDGPGLIKRIGELAPDIRGRIHAEATAGDYRTPTCPRCGIKMVKRVGAKGKGKGTGQAFWGCSNYPRCHQTFTMRNNEPEDGPRDWY